MTLFLSKSTIYKRYIYVYKKHWIALSILLIPCIGNAQEIKIDESWLHQSLNVIGRTDSRFGPRLTNDLYPEYTVAGRKDWFDFMVMLIYRNSLASAVTMMLGSGMRAHHYLRK